MAEYNPSKIIKDGNTYNFRDTTKIPLAGSNEISGSLVPSTDGTVNLGSSTAQWNNAYIKSLTINGTQFLPSDYATLSGLSAVATSGSYNDLSNKPTIPTVNNGTLTIQQNGTTVDTFTANSSSDKTVNIQCVDLTNNQTVGGNKEFTGTTTAHDVIPSDTDTYNFGSSTAQWNNAYIKSLTINGVACGDILTHNASEFVGVSGNQTIDGVKTFSNGDKTFNDSAPLRIQGCNKGNEFSSNARTVLELRSNRDTANKSCIYITKFRQNRAQGAMGGNDNVILTMDVLENEVRTNDLLRFTAHNWINDIPTEMYLEPTTKASNIQSFLGSPSRPWGNTTTNAINGINPGALSLPGTSVNVDTTNWVLDGTVNVFTPTSDGWFGIQVTDTVYDQMHYVFVGRNDSASYYQQNVLSPINALWDSKYHGCIFIPVVKNYNYDIRCICSTIVATFYPCQGNV